MNGWRGSYRRHKLLWWLFALGVVWQLLSSWNVIPDVSKDDTSVHFFFSIIVSQVVFLIIRQMGQIKDEAGKVSEFTRFGTILLVLLGGVTIGCLWEITEFALDHIAGAHLQHGNTDTVTDLIADTCGSLLGGFIMAYGRQLADKYRRKS